LTVNGEAIYGTRPWDVCQNETDNSVYYTKKDDRLYAHFIAWPTENTLNLDSPMATAETQVYFLGLNATAQGRVGWTDVTANASSTSRRTRAGMQLKLPALTPDIIPCDHAWVVVLTGVANL
jgi:alpha-L-fucosidase